MSDALREQVRRRFAALAADPNSVQPFAFGPASAAALGYAPAELAELPPAVVAAFAGVGNPLALGPILPGETVLDIGCGTGTDCLLAGRRVGPTGQVVGVDMTAEMITTARHYADRPTVTYHHADAERLPLPDASVDVALSNGVFNLCPDKPAVLAELLRVLKPNGRLQMADVLLADDATAADGDWSA